MSWIEDPGIANFKGFNISRLGLDEAWVNVTSFVEQLFIYELSSDCHKVSIIVCNIHFLQKFAFLICM